VGDFWVGAQSTLRGKSFLPENIYNKMPKFYYICPKNKQNSQILNICLYCCACLFYCAAEWSMCLYHCRSHCPLLRRLSTIHARYCWCWDIIASDLLRASVLLTRVTGRLLHSPLNLYIVCLFELWQYLYVVIFYRRQWTTSGSSAHCILLSESKVLFSVLWNTSNRKTVVCVA